MYFIVIHVVYVSNSQVLDMFGSLLERPLIAADAKKRYPVLVKMFDKELDRCRVLYRKHMQSVEQLGEIEKHETICLYIYILYILALSIA